MIGSTLLATVLLLTVLLLPRALHAAEAAGSGAASAPPPCSDHGDSFSSCGLSSADREKAEALYRRATTLARHKRYDEALEKLRAAREISPRDTLYASTEQALRHKLAAEQVRLGEQAMQLGDSAAARAAFGRALDLDPDNDYAVQRLRDAGSASPDTSPDKSGAPPDAGAGARLSALAALSAESSVAEADRQAQASMGEVNLRPASGIHSFEYRGQSPDAFAQFGKLYGIEIVEDTHITSRKVRIALDNVDWETGSQILERVCKFLVVPLSEHQAMIADDTADNRSNLIRSSLETFYVPNADEKQITDLSTALRVLFDLRFLQPSPQTHGIIVRAPEPLLRDVGRFLDDLQEDTPNVMLQIQVYEVSTQFTRELGLGVPDQFSVFNVTSEVESLVQGSSYSQILSALQALGQSATPATILGALLASGSSGNPLAQPFATFGGGTGLTGVTIPGSSANFNFNRSVAHSLDDVLLRTQNGDAATMKLGERYPIVSTLYSASTPAGNLLSSLGLSSEAAAANSAATTVPSPQFSYEDLGIVLKVTPRVQRDQIELDYEFSIRALGPLQSDGLPLITSRQNNGAISTADGKPVVMAGLVTRAESLSVSGIPALSDLPGLGAAFSTRNKQTSRDELVIVITPHLTTLHGEKRGLYLTIPTNLPK